MTLVAGRICNQNLHKSTDTFLEWHFSALCLYVIYSKCRAEEVYENIRETRETYLPIAQQAAVIFTVAANMTEINEFYQLTIERFMEYFASAIKHSDR